MTATPTSPAAPFTPEDDNYHVLSDDPWETETTWWSANIPERRMGIWLHAARMPNRGIVNWKVFVWDPDGTDPSRLTYYRTMQNQELADDADLRDITFPGGGFSVRMLSPLRDYEITYADPDADFAIEFEHRSVHDPVRFPEGVPPMMQNVHLDQLGHITGTLTLRGERIPIDCFSIRDRTWGPRKNHHTHGDTTPKKPVSHDPVHPGGPVWRQVERQRRRGRIQYIFGHTDASTGFLGFVRPQEGTADGWSPLNVGWLLRDGRFESLDANASRMKVFRDPRTGWTSHMLADVTDVSGRRLEAEGFAVSRMSEHGTGANSLMRWEYDGKVGWGEDQDGWRPAHFTELMRALRTSR